MTSNHSEIRRAAHGNGARARRALADYLRAYIPELVDKPGNGWRMSSPGLTWHAHYAVDLSDSAIDVAITAAVDDAVAAGDDYGIVVQRRAGKSDPGRWYAWLPLPVVCTLASIPGHRFLPGTRMPVRLQLCDVVQLLIRADYGQAQQA